MLALLVNAGAIGFATDASARLARIGAVLDTATPGAAMVLVPARAEPDRPAIDHGAATPEARGSMPRSAGPRAPKARTSQVDTAPAEPVLFYSFHEVDSPAFPRADWNLDVDTLDTLGVQRLVFEVLVSDRGEVLGCTVLEPHELADDAKRSLESRLSQTLMLPAIREGRLVASVRRIELTVAAAPPDERGDPPVHRP